jgi:acetoacetyl-CoA synthetase
MTEKPLWTPSPEHIRASNLARFMALVKARTGAVLSSYEDVHAFSIAHPESFWALIWDFSGIKASIRGERVLVDGDKIPGARFFPDARLNVAENLLRRADDTTALIFRGEDKVASEVTWRQLTDKVSRMAAALRRLGLKAGDRASAVVANHPDTIAVFLAAASIGAIWSSCSPDFGERGIIDRFGQIEPRLLIAVDGYYYAGKTHDIGDKIVAVAGRLASVDKVVVLDYIGTAAATARRIPGAVTLDELIGGQTAGPIDFAQLPFDHPLYILYSSGTTGIPKCIVHRAGGALLKHLCEQQLSVDLRPSDRLFYFTTCGWMMWNWLVSGLASGATLLLYDGSPFHPSERVLFDYAVEAGMTIFGTSAKYIDALKKTGWRPCDTHDLSRIRAMMSTGSPLAPESFDFVYEAIKPDIHLASMSGGTDLCGCFVAGNPIGPVWRGEIQAQGLGLDMAVYDDDGRPMAAGKGELVCRNAFPTMPIMFWNDPDGSKYHNAYFSRFPSTWCHGDFAEWTAHGGMIIHGRSDATLNPGGVRIGTAEIYAQVEQIPEVVEALAIGQDWDNDTRVVLFVRLREGAALDEALIARIKARIRAGASPRHVPARIVAVADIPRTKSGKITELAVRDIVHGREVKNREALANPEALELFANLPALQA